MDSEEEVIEEKPQISTADMKKVIDNAAERAHKGIHYPNSLSDKANPHIIINLVCTDIARGMYRVALGETEEIDPPITEDPDVTDPEEPTEPAEPGDTDELPDDEGGAA